MSKSFALLSTNVGLTTNIKIMVDSNYNLSLNSIDSKEELSANKFKKVPFIKNNYYDELINYFYGDLPTDTAFHIKYDNDVDTMANDYANQYDELYQYGARNISNNKDYSEEFEYFAPLYISPNNLPKNFIIFRVDGAGIDNITKDNVRTKIFNNFKTVKLFDLTKSSKLGEWLDLNFNNNSFFPLTPFEMSFDNLEFSKWNGIDYQTGGYTSKSMFLESVYEEEKEIFELEKFVFDGYKNNKVVFPNILNFSFLFDDTPANSDTLRKWSINRYYGFYLDDMIKTHSISPYITPFIKSDATILSDNILHSDSGDPFLEGFVDYKPFYVEYNNEYYKVEKFTEIGNKKLMPVLNGNVVTQQYVEETITKYKIISNLDLSGKQSFLNKNTGLINSENILLNYDLTYYTISDWETADIWIIEIDGVYHNLVRENIVEGLNTNTIIRINSDYSFSINENDYTYWINKDDPSYTKKVSFLVDENNKPKKFNIYKLKFTDIKDFDNRIVDTEYSKYEYEKKYSLTDTDETKMYFINLSSNSNPKDYDDFIYKENVVNIPVSSEYTANYETFKINKNELSEIWRKNPIYCRWGYQNSLSSNDYPYLLNNSLIFEDFNRTTNPFINSPSRIERNLDYFYTINSSTSSYVHHTLHIENKINGDIDTSLKFELDKYLNIGTYSYDYFTLFFERKMNFYDGDKNVKKYSILNKGNSSIPNITLFRGIKFLLYEVDSVKKNNGKIDVLNLSSNNLFDNYKFSILLSDNEKSVINTIGNNATMSSSSNTMNWTIIDEWKMDKTYNTGDVVIMDDILYVSMTDSNTTTNPIYNLSKSAPYNQSNWNNLTDYIFWSYNKNYNQNEIVFNSGDYYYKKTGTDDFWNPTLTYPYYGNLTDTYSYGKVITVGNKYLQFTITEDISSYNSTIYVYKTDGSNLIIGGNIIHSLSVYEISGGNYIYDLNINDNIDFTGIDPNTLIVSYSPSYYPTVLFNGNYYYSLTQSNMYRPDQKCWAITQSISPGWSPILLWNPISTYTQSFVVHNDIVYSCISSMAGNEPGISNVWNREYSLVPDSSIIYNPSLNPIIEMNNSYYLINSNSTSSTLENGINIYINKRWKNVLINISISDNTIPNISESDRDDLYIDLNRKLTAYNFIQCINDISNKYGFTDYLNYIIIDENNNITKYNYENIEGLPYCIFCETPDEISMKKDSLIYKPIQTPKSLKSSKTIKSINNDLSNINDYNDLPIATEITKNNNSPEVVINYSGNKSITKSTIYRFSGFYMPIFYEIQLFSKDYIGNYKFNTELLEFGISKERKIRKVNHKKSILKLIDKEKSIYPMLDEFGYTFIDFFIFKSSWDIEYYKITEL